LLKLHGSVSPRWTPCPLYAIDAEIPKLDVAGSNPVSRSIFQQLRDTHRFLVIPFIPLSRVCFRSPGFGVLVFEAPRLRVF
jgi:hypothetical protein